MNFIVSADDRLRNVRAVFATEADLPLVERWQSVPVPDENPHMRDAVIFSKLACKWWQYYAQQGASAASLTELRTSISRNPRQEIAFLMMAKAEWHGDSPVLGLCCCRRTWCNHIVLEFAAVNPLVIGSVSHQIRGVGTGMLHCLVEIADELKVGTVWGETTANSAPFYEKVLGLPQVQDHFFISGPTMDHCRRQLGVIKKQAQSAKGLKRNPKYATVSYNAAQSQSKIENPGTALGIGVAFPVFGRKSSEPKRLRCCHAA